MEFKFRFANNKDLEHFVYLDKKMRIEEPDIYFEYREENYRQDWQKYSIGLNNLGDVILCFLEDEIIARIDLNYIRSYMDFSLVGYVDWIYVRPHYRGRGIGKQLLAEAEKQFYESTDLTIKIVKKGQKKLV
jgi:GNAT superfamily N-acetyltransferase